VNHTAFWTNLSPEGGGKPEGELAAALDDAFGSFDAFRAHFQANALAIQGSGWSILGWDSLGQRPLIFQLYDQQGNVPAGIVPLALLDMWEPAGDSEVTGFGPRLERRVEHCPRGEAVEATQATTNFEIGLRDNPHSTQRHESGRPGLRLEAVVDRLVQHLMIKIVTSMGDDRIGLAHHAAPGARTGAAPAGGDSRLAAGFVGHRPPAGDSDRTPRCARAA